VIVATSNAMSLKLQRLLTSSPCVLPNYENSSVLIGLHKGNGSYGSIMTKAAIFVDVL